MTDEKRINLENYDGEPANNLGVKHINVQERSNGVHLQEVDENGRKSPLKHEDLLTAYGHVVMPEAIKAAIKEIESPGTSDNRRQELQDEVAAWQKEYTDTWRADNVAYDPNSDEYEGFEPEPSDDQGDDNGNGGTGNGGGNGGRQDTQIYQGQPIVIKNFNRNSIDGNTIGGGAGGASPNQDPGQNPNQTPGYNPNQPLDNPEVQLLRAQLEEAQRRNEQLEREKEELQARFDEQAQKIEELNSRIDALENPPPPPGPSPEDIQQAEANLNSARDELAKYDIRRSARITDRLFKRRKEDAEDYKEALAKYVEAQEALAQLIITRERALNTEDAEIRKKLTEMKFDESAKYAERLVEMNDENFKNVKGIKRPFALMLRRYANVSTRNKILLGLLIGGGAAAASVVTGAGLAVLVAGSATRFSLGLVNHHASLRNVSKHSLEKQLKEIQKEREKALGSLGTAELDDHAKELMDLIKEERQANTRGNVRRNRRGTALMLGGATLSALGIAGAEGIHLIPDTGWLNLHWPKGWPSLHNPFGGHSHNALQPTTTGGGPGFDSIAGGHLPPKFQMDTIYAHNTTDFINHTFGHQGLLERQGIKVHGLTHEKARDLAEYLQNHHWRVVEGMQANGHGGLEQHVVDASSWGDGIHNPSHAQAWTSKQELENAMRIAREKFNISFS